MKQLKKRKKGGFTLIEMVVVIAIVVIIAAIAIPQALKAVNKSKASTDIANARTMAGEIMNKVADGKELATAISEANTNAAKSKVKTGVKLVAAPGTDNESVTVKIETFEVYPKVTNLWEKYAGSETTTGETTTPTT